MKIVKPVPSCPEEKAYLAYIDEHRKNVFSAFMKFGKTICLGLSLVQGEYDILKRYVNRHDASKYDKEEFDGYRQWFYPKEGEEKNKEVFQAAWHHHYRNNPHHWEYYVDHEKASPMPKLSIAEMILDWIAMSMKFKNSPADWYNQNKDNILLHKDTKDKTESVLKMLSGQNIYPFRVSRNYKTGRRPRNKK